jgi:hypothetical protein
VPSPSTNSIGVARRELNLTRVVLLAVALSAGCGSNAAQPAGVAGDAGDADAGSAAGGAASGSACPSAPPAPETGNVVPGDLIIRQAADAVAAFSVAEVAGSLVIEPSFPGELSLPNLQNVAGDVRLEGHAVAGMPESQWAAITALRLPNLQSVGGELYVYLTGQLVETDFRRLAIVGEQIYFMRNLALRRVGLDALMAGSVSIQASPVAAACEIEAICARVGSMGCGAEYSDPACSCEMRCGRLEPRCAD